MQALLVLALSALLCGASPRGSLAADSPCTSQCVATDSNTEGEDYLHFPSPNATDCQAACCADAASCYSWTWTWSQPQASDNCTQGSRCCWLKSTAAELTPRPNCISGLVRHADLQKTALTSGPAACAPTCARADSNSEGEDYLHFPSPNATNCQAACCADAASCRSWTWTWSQPNSSDNCTQGSRCCWLKSTSQGQTPRANCISSEGPRYAKPVLARVSTIALDPTGHLRDPSSVVFFQGQYHFIVDYIPLSQGTQSGWRAYLHWYSASSVLGPWTNHGLIFNHSAAPSTWDSGGTFSPSLIYSEEEQLWFVFYSATSANYSSTLESAQMVASAPALAGPWKKLGVVAQPTGSPPAYNTTWNARRLDSGRAMVINGTKGYYTKGVSSVSFAQEGVYFPRDPSSFAPPYAEGPKNPIFPNASRHFRDGFENCELFKGPLFANSTSAATALHVICQSHGGGGQPHFIATGNGQQWALVGEISTAPALEPTPVYAGMPTEAADVRYFIARASPKGAVKTLHIDLFRLSWA